MRCRPAGVLGRVLMPPWNPLAGASWGFRSTQEESSGKQLTVVVAGDSGDLAWCLATYSEGKVSGDGTLLNIFEREANGNWLIRICSMNSADSETGE